MATAQCAPHCWAGRTLLVLAAASSGVGECQGGVKSIETMMVVKFGMVGQAGKRARAEQSAWQHSERGDKPVGTVHTRGHRVHFGIEPRLAPISCLACSPSCFGLSQCFELSSGAVSWNFNTR